MRVQGRVLIQGTAVGPILRLEDPISFWGGVDPATGRVIEPRHANRGAQISGRVLAIPATIGSSSSSAIMLELLREGTAPSALLLGRVDAILALGVVVARELGYTTIPVLEISQADFAALPASGEVRVSEDGTVAVR